MLQCVILSGGSGTRLWPLSRELFPKQLINLQGGDETLLQATLTRTEGLPGLLPPAIVCNENHRFLVAEQVRALGVSGAKVILEPCARNTAPAIALAALAADPETLLLVLPADHVIQDKAAFQTAVATAIAMAEQGKLVTFGVVPSAPETGYGYIRCGKSLGQAFHIDRFIEKPDRTTAEGFLTSGGYLWNSGMFLFKASRYLEELAKHAPAILESAREAVSAAKSDLDFLRVDAAAFAKCPSDSIDYAVMEKTDSAAVVPLDAGWSDVGSWSSLHDALDRDASGNALRGDVLSVDTEGSFVLAESRLVATVGVKDHVVVETKDAVLVAPKGRVQDVKKLVEKIKQDGRSEHQLHREVHRPWGSYDSIENGARYQVKRLSVKPGASMSLQLHHHRAEHWIVVAGTARITRGDEVFILEENQSTYIPLGVKHRIENPGKIPLHIIEVQSGSYLGEDDIVRFEDRYGR
ncbi:MAG: mannose-1-phosphate guanylyltransferase/mannose-6-phosphate isomerase [Gammaproteobacteria bacterium]|nr:mannose-1-phosphate guanylyltransferase/mannose-6-phosphate isomerase [Gammaproteobacteria bacterium]